MINCKKMSLTWKLYLAEMTVLVLLLGVWDVESECWG